MDSLSQGASEPDVRQGVVEVALRHHLVSKYTSLVAVDLTPTAPEGLAKTRPLPVNMPHGWSHEAVFGPLPQGGTAAQLLTALGFLVMILAFLVLWSKDKSCRETRSVFRSR